MKQSLFVLIGSALGGVTRYWISQASTIIFGKNFPYGTFIVNCAGSFLIGFFTTVFLSRFYTHDNALKYLLIIGFLGGLTTFSSFSFETLQLLQTGSTMSGIFNIILNVTASLGAVFLGYIVGKYFC